MKESQCQPRHSNSRAQALTTEWREQAEEERVVGVAVSYFTRARFVHWCIFHSLGIVVGKYEKHKMNVNRGFNLGR